MSAPTSIEVSVDLEEYSRFEEERNTVLCTVIPNGSNLTDEEIVLELIKARYGRDEVVSTKTLTLLDSSSAAYQVDFSLKDIVDEQNVSKVRRGKYFVRATSSSNSVVTANTDDFYISLISVARLKADYLHGTDQFATNVLSVKDQPSKVTGVTVESTSIGHPQNWFPLSFNFAVQRTPTVTGVVSEPFSLADHQTLILRLNGSDTYTVVFETADFSDITAATLAEVISVINDQLSGYVVASANTGKLQLTGGTTSILVDPAGTATTALGLLGKSDTPTVIRTLTWCNGPIVRIEPSKKTYTLRRGSAADFIQVRVSSIALLPTESVAEDLLVYRKALDDERIRSIINQSISWVEDTALQVYLEPTRIVTEVDPDAITYGSGTDIPALVGATWDEVVDGLTYTTPNAGHWIGFKFPYLPIIRIDELYGKLSNVRILDVALEWLEPHKASGWCELVPFNQESAFNFIGLVWTQSLRGPVPLPNFWNFNALVGYEQTPGVVIELVAKKAAIDVLTIAGQAFRPGLAGTSISRDGVSESVSYVSNAGIFGATITEYRQWISDNLNRMKNMARGVNMIVL